MTATSDRLRALNDKEAMSLHPAAIRDAIVSRVAAHPRIAAEAGHQAAHKAEIAAAEEAARLAAEAKPLLTGRNALIAGGGLLALGGGGLLARHLMKAPAEKQAEADKEAWSNPFARAPAPPNQVELDRLATQRANAARTAAPARGRSAERLAQARANLQATGALPVRAAPAAEKGFMHGVGEFAAKHAPAALAGGAVVAGVGGAGLLAHNMWKNRAGAQPEAQKMGSIATKIAGTINKTDFDVFEQQFQEPAVADLLRDCPDVVTSLAKIASAGVGRKRGYESAIKVASAQRMDVVQVRPTKYGYMVKWAAAPDGAAQPQEQEVSVPQAQQALPQQMLETADQQGMATTTNVEAQPDPMAENPQSVAAFGMYKVYEAGTGKQIVGFVVPTMFDPRTGQETPTKLFLNGGQYAMQPDIVGVLVGISYNLPQGGSEPRGLGVFYKTNGKSITVTIPFNVMNSVTVDGRQYYAAQTQDGLDCQITPSDGLQRPQAAGPEIAMPADYVWIPLDNVVQLEGQGVGASAATGNAPDPMAAVKAASMPTMGRIRAWSDGYGNVSQVSLDGPVFSKIASLQNSPADAVFYMAAAGMHQNLSVAVIEKAASTGEVIKLYGLQPLGLRDETSKHAAADALAGLTGVKIPPRHCLLKEAMAIELCKEAKALVGVDSLDSLLAIGFINPENIQDFVDYLPELEETQSKLSSLVFATQLGLQSIPKTACVSAMNALESVIKGLHGLQSYKL